MCSIGEYVRLNNANTADECEYAMKCTHLWRHEAFGRFLARPGDGPHPRARDEVKVGLPGRVEEGHLVDGAVVGGHAERDDLQLGQARRHRERLAAVRVLVNVPVAMSIN